MPNFQKLVTTATTEDIARGGEPGQRYEVDSVDTFCEAVKIGRTVFYADAARGLIKIVKRGKRTLVPPGERRAYLERLAVGGL